MNESKSFPILDPGTRVLMGPGPSNVPERVLQAMAHPCIGHLDPYFLGIMDETQQLLRSLFRTENALTIPVSGTGSAGMETCFVNLVEPGDKVLVCVNGVFGTRMCDIVTRIGGDLIRVDFPWGKTVDPSVVEKMARETRPDIISVVHAETSTGACSSLADLSDVARNSKSLFLVDAVTSLGGMAVDVDVNGIDAAYSGTQKCLSCPPGLSPVTFGPKAVEKLEARKTPVMSWYLDLGMVGSYWGKERKYHHTAPINMTYALREALLIIEEEGLEARILRHRRNHRTLIGGLEAMGLKMLVDETDRLPMLNAVCIPDGVDDGKVRSSLLADYSIEIGGGLGELAGKIWRVGIMGASSTRANVVLFLGALFSVLKKQGADVSSDWMEAIDD